MGAALSLCGKGNGEAQDKKSLALERTMSRCALRRLSPSRARATFLAGTNLQLDLTGREERRRIWKLRRSRRRDQRARRKRLDHDLSSHSPCWNDLELRQPRCTNGFVRYFLTSSDELMSSRSVTSVELDLTPTSFTTNALPPLYSFLASSKRHMYHSRSLRRLCEDCKLKRQ